MWDFIGVIIILFFVIRRLPEFLAEFGWTKKNSDLWVKGPYKVVTEADINIFRPYGRSRWKATLYKNGVKVYSASNDIGTYARHQCMRYANFHKP